MANTLKLNPAVSGTDQSKHIPRTFAVLNDSEGNDVTSTNPLPVTSIGSLLDVSYDYIGVAYPTTTTEVYTYKDGGSGGTTVATITVTYSDATKEQLTSVERS